MLLTALLMILLGILSSTVLFFMLDIEYSFQKVTTILKLDQYETFDIVMIWPPKD